MTTIAEHNAAVEKAREEGVIPTETLRRVAVVNHPRYEEIAAVLDSAQHALNKLNSTFRNGEVDGFDAVVWELVTAALDLQNGLAREVVRSGYPMLNARELILEYLNTSGGASGQEGRMIYGWVARREPRLRDRDEQSWGRDSIDVEMPARSITHHGPVWTALGELVAGGIVQTLNPGGGYTQRYRLASKAPARGKKS